MTNQRNCAFCGRFFTPDVRVAARQKSCKEPSCQSKRKRVQEKIWRESEQNAEYFKGRSANTKAWRVANPGHQKQWRAKKRREIQTQICPPTPMQSVRLHLRLGFPIGEIQTQFCLVRQDGKDIWVDGAHMHPR